MSGLPRTFSFEGMGTSWELRVWDTLGQDSFDDFCRETVEQTREFERLYSRFDESSLVWELATAGGTREVPEDLVTMLRIYETLYALSEGRCNPLVGFSLSDLGYDAHYTLRAKDDVRPTPPLPETLRIVDDWTIELSVPALIDIGALGKGYFVDKIADRLRAFGVRRFLVDGSGDIAYEGDGHPLRVGLEHPFDPTKVVGVLEMTTGSLCGSGANRRAWDGKHHIIDPLTLSSTSEIAATWVYAKRACIADALATCFFLAEPERFTRTYDVEYCMLDATLRTKKSAGFAADFF